MADRELKSPERWLAVGVICLAAALQVGVVAWRFDQLTNDRDVYLDIAKNVVEGRGFSTPETTKPTAYRPPLYPLLLAAAMKAVPAAWAVAIVNLVAGLITVWLVLRLGKLLGLRRWRFIAGLMTAGNPLLLNAMAQPMTELVFTALVTALWSVLVAEVAKTSDIQSMPRKSWRLPLRAFHPLLIGVLFGLAALCRPTIWPLAGLTALAWLVLRNCLFGPLAPAAGERVRERGRALQTALLCVLGTLLVVAPWVVRNQLVFGRPILTTTHGGYTLFLANNPMHDVEVVQRPWGATWSVESLDRWQRKLTAEMHDKLGPAADELMKDRWMSQQAKYYIKDHPDRFLAAAWHRVRSLWSIAPRGEGTTVPASLRALVAAFFAVEFILAIVGAWVLIRSRYCRAWLPGFLLIVTIQGVHLVYWTDTRMRTPLEPVLALLAARACSAVFSRGKHTSGDSIP